MSVYRGDEHRENLLTDVTSCILLEVYRRLGSILRPPLSYCLGVLETAGSSETSVVLFCQTTRRHMAQDSDLQKVFIIEI